ncbi:MAG: Gfo/Idh/MocA family oxidoreductase [Caldilineaceae bacterium]|nr:Gfo/Idh/MocA family oxidoreductase [Caldilineaceae bacterium]
MYRAAVIGLGRMGSTFDDEITEGGTIFLPYAHAPSYHASPKVTLVAGADPHPEQRALFGQRWGVSEEHLYADYRTMLEKERLDLVSICTTARLRATIIQAAADAGVKAIWAEKPIAMTLQEADTVVELCRQKGVALAINCARRWNPFYSTTRRLIESGELGNILQVNGYGQCSLSHNGSHLLDTICYLAGGRVSWVFGEMESDEKAASNDDLMGNGYLAFDNGVRAYVRSMPTGLARWEFDVIGDRGRVRLAADGHQAEWYRMVEGGLRNAGVPAQTPLPWPATMQGMGLTIVDDLINAVETGQPPRCSGEDGRAALEIALALRESHRQGGIKISLPLADRTLHMVSVETKGDDTPARIRRLQKQA